MRWRQQENAPEDTRAVTTRAWRVEESRRCARGPRVTRKDNPSGKPGGAKKGASRAREGADWLPCRLAGQAFNRPWPNPNPRGARQPPAEKLLQSKHACNRPCVLFSSCVLFRQVQTTRLPSLTHPRPGSSLPVGVAHLDEHLVDGGVEPGALVEDVCARSRGVNRDHYQRYS